MRAEGWLPQHLRRISGWSVGALLIQSGCGHKTNSSKVLDIGDNEAKLAAYETCTKVLLQDSSVRSESTNRTMLESFSFCKDYKKNQINIADEKSSECENSGSSSSSGAKIGARSFNLSGSHDQNKHKDRCKSESNYKLFVDDVYSHVCSDYEKDEKYFNAVNENLAKLGPKTVESFNQCIAQIGADAHATQNLKCSAQISEDVLTYTVALLPSSGLTEVKLNFGGKNLDLKSSQSQNVTVKVGGTGITGTIKLVDSKNSSSFFASTGTSVASNTQSMSCKSWSYSPWENRTCQNGDLVDKNDTRTVLQKEAPECQVKPGPRTGLHLLLNGKPTKCGNDGCNPLQCVQQCAKLGGRLATVDQVYYRVKAMSAEALSNNITDAYFYGEVEGEPYFFNPRALPAFDDLKAVYNKNGGNFSRRPITDERPARGCACWVD